MKGGSLYYRCRYCGTVEKRYHAPEIMTAVVYTVTQHFPEDFGAMRPGLIETHSCKDGRIGVADFIGAEEDKEE